MEQFETPSLPLGSICIDWTINARPAMRRETTLAYAEALGAGARFPPVTVFFDGATYWLADGFHRYVAHEIVGAAEIPVEIRLGTPRAAVLYSATANSLHGLRPTKSDRRKAIIRLLEDPEWALWNDQQIATLCDADPATVGELRRALDRFLAANRPTGDSLPAETPMAASQPQQIAS